MQRLPKFKLLKAIVTSRNFGYVMIAAIFLGILSFQFFMYSTLKKMEVMSNDSYDNSVWIVSQMEVDLQGFLLAVHEAILDAPTGIQKDAVAEVAENFDIYYSRIAIVSARTRKIVTLKGATSGPDLELEQIEDNLRSLVLLIDEIEGKNPEYFRKILHLGNSILPTLRTKIMMSLQEGVRADALVDSNSAATLQIFLIIAQGMAVLLAVIAAVVWRLLGQIHKRNLDFARINSNLNKAIETSLDAIIITDINGKISTHNLAAERMFDFTASSLKGAMDSNMLNLGRQPVGNNGSNGRRIATILANSANRGRLQLKLQKTDGADFMVEVAVASDVDIDGAPIFLAFLRDISKLVEADSDERAARFEAERSAAANARFLAVMSHEMRTPLHGIIAALELLEGLDTDTDEKHRLLCKIALDCTGSALEQIEEVLELSSNDAADVLEVGLTFFPLEIARIIVEQSQSVAANNNTALTLTFDPEVSEPMLGNRRAFRSALANLVGNAVKFTKGGKITVRLYPTPNDRGSMRVEVKDLGKGIEPQHLIRIFEDFQTVSLASHETQSASGLGLGIVRRAVGLMGGTLQCESTFGKGSCFWFDIPRTSVILEDAKLLDTAQSATRTPALTLLVVDDIAINRLLLAQMLESMGHIVEMAVDGKGAIESAMHQRFDLILMDINMPGMNGVEAARRIRMEGASVEVPIMGVTANAQASELMSFKDAGLDYTLVKPFTSAALALMVREVSLLRKTNAKSESDFDKHLLLASENFSDLQSAMSPGDLSVLVENALYSAGSALVEARVAPFGAAIADQFHQAAGSVAMIGAIRLHWLLCALEDAMRAGKHEKLEQLLDDAERVNQETCHWINGVLSQG
jgi:PAS domain S-box-containing protein